ncbi:hypothetical protein WR25_17805 [Diploscapter pachys]|uniref:SXP/RAL-2 family protein Ani s 5-like cation-binding domain-containing protein n=1 Tax=Diploscapter pachys TaxID=2018661 RepID=A0A2A2KNC4_9BILA|nr:hypothetical protein WR25_17805 [Diploscapter pachys]
MTFDLLGTLTSEERTVVFGPPAIPVEDSFDTVPMFIKTMMPDVKKDFDKIWTDSEMKDEDKYKKLDELASTKFSEPQKASYKVWLEEVKKAKKAVDDRIAKLSKQAKDILKRLIEVRAQEQKIMAEITPALDVELQGLI